MATPAIEIENLTKDYPFGFLHLKKKTSLEGLTMSVEDGEVFGFLGPNGAGKSTTIKLLMGLIFPTAGTARILGKSINDISMHADIGYLPEQPYFYDYLTAAELLDYFGRFHDLSAQERKVRVDRMLKKVGLETARKIPGCTARDRALLRETYSAPLPPRASLSAHLYRRRLCAVRLHQVHEIFFQRRLYLRDCV